MVVVALALAACTPPAPTAHPQARDYGTAAEFGWALGAYRVAHPQDFQRQCYDVLLLLVASSREIGGGLAPVENMNERMYQQALINLSRIDDGWDGVDTGYLIEFGSACDSHPNPGDLG